MYVRVENEGEGRVEGGGGGEAVRSIDAGKIICVTNTHVHKCPCFQGSWHKGVRSKERRSLQV